MLANSLSAHTTNTLGVATHYYEFISLPAAAFKSLKSSVSEGIVCFVSSGGSSSLRLRFVKQAAPSATLTCNIYPECIGFATTMKVISIQMSEAAGGEESFLNGGNGCRSPRRVFVAPRIGAGEREVRCVSPLMK